MDLASSSPDRSGRQSSGRYGRKAGKAIALGVGAGLGAVGAGVGIGYIFGKVIESVTRQPEMRDEITSIQWLGFALTEAMLLLRPRRRPASPSSSLGPPCHARSPPPRQLVGQLPRHPRRRADDLDAGRLRVGALRPAQGRVPAHRRGARQAPERDRGVDRRGRADPQGGRRAARRVPRAAARRRARRPTRSSPAPARPARRTSARPSRRPRAKREELLEQTRRDIEAETAARSRRSAARSPT